MNAHAGPVVGEPVWPVTKALWEHQLKALARSYDRAAFAFDFDPGCGKTGTVIAEAGRMFLDGEIDTLIVCAPNRVHRQWVVSAFPEWATYRWQGAFWPKGGLKSGKAKAAWAGAMRLSEFVPALRVFTFNFDVTRIGPTRAGQPPKLTPALIALEEAIKTSRKGVYFCVDESHRIKDHTAQQTRAMLRYGRGVSKVRRRLTGTPILQGVQDLWSQYAFLDRAIIGQSSFYGFRATYCKTAPVPGRPNAARITGPKNLDDLMARIAPFTARVRKTDAMDMPDKLFIRESLEMEPAQERAYNQMKALMMSAVDGGDGQQRVVVASIVLTQLQKLLQIASGFVMDENGLAHWVSDAKIEAVADKVDDLGGEHCVVWAPYIPLLDRLQARFGDKATRFRELSDIDVWAKKGGPLIANPASGGVGVDGMQKHACRAFYAANAFHYEFRVQSIDRLHRGGQSRTCFYTDFLTEGTEDEKVLDVLANREAFDGLTVAKLKALLFGK